MNILKSEYTKKLSDEEIVQLQRQIADMSPDDLEDFRSNLDPDLMGPYGKEAM